ncbi:MAG: hypothetical protein FWG65_07425 [Turicibacter sp.]|nr:hypothetical protein [Turicibacter sp.]
MAPFFDFDGCFYDNVIVPPKRIFSDFDGLVRDFCERADRLLATNHKWLEERQGVLTRRLSEIKASSNENKFIKHEILL